MENDFLTDLLKEQQAVATKIEDNKFKSSKRKSIKPPTHFMIPPSRANIRFNLDKGKFKTIAPKFKAPKIPLPEYWANYDSSVSKFARYVSRPENQQKCGSCFAFASASAINDVFIFGRRLKFNPDISPLSILSCINDKTCNLQCDGGDPLGVLDNIAMNGITTNNCMNYHQVCTSIPSCYQPIKKAFDEAKRDQVFRSANSPIKLPPCGCCPACDNNFSYYINQPILVSENTATNIQGRSDAVYNIKHHLFVYGAAVTGYVVYSNFVNDTTNGKFKKTRGIYIESENYCPPTIKNYKEFMGCHAVSIVGWGIEKNPIQLDNGTTLKETPYWIVRNSWSDKWGYKGYFKMAMYQKVGNTEINPTTSFERINTVNIKGQTFQMGGTIIFTPKKFVKYNNNRKDCKSTDKCNESSPIDNIEKITRADVGDITKDDEEDEFPIMGNNKVIKSNKKTIKYIIYGIAIFFGIAFLIYLISSMISSGSNKKRRNRKK